MKRITAALIAGSLTSLSAASFASSISLTDAFGPTESKLALEDARLHADQLFNQVDVNKDSVLSINEYASQAVVLASLARFNGKVAIDGEETFSVALPEEVRTEIRSIEQTAIDAVARNEFYKISGSDLALTRNEWLQTKLAEFAAADFNRNGALEGEELEVFAMNIARYKITMS